MIHRGKIIIMKKLDIKKDHQFCYSIRLEKDFSNLADEIVNLGFTGHKLCIVTDSNVAPIYLDTVKSSFLEKFDQVFSFVIPAGEQNKTLDQVKKLYEYLIFNHFDRKDCLVALGGGVIGDMTGYTAATYLRGIDFIQVPTTLLSQVDSSIGGKTGVDFDSYKNMVGAFHMPRLVYMNLSVLNTLSEEQFSCGMGEILKHGLIKNKEYFFWCMENAEKIKKRDYDTLLHMILESCKIKGHVVEKDPTEQGDRALLNFGHTLGHAVEKLKDFKLLHGQCVAVGSIAAMKLSSMRGNISETDVLFAEKCFKAFGLPTRINELAAEDILKISKSDKKMEAGKIKFVLLHEIGNAYVDKTVSDEELLTVSEYILNE
jgi:3-dehydroquinate synthase